MQNQLETILNKIRSQLEQNKILYEKETEKLKESLKEHQQERIESEKKLKEDHCTLYYKLKIQLNVLKQKNYFDQKEIQKLKIQA